MNPEPSIRNTWCGAAEGGVAVARTSAGIVSAMSFMRGSFRPAKLVFPAEGARIGGDRGDSQYNAFSAHPQCPLRREVCFRARRSGAAPDFLPGAPRRAGAPTA